MILQIFASFLEMAAVYIMMPFVSALYDSESILKYGIFEMLYKSLHFNCVDDFIVFISFFTGSLYVIKSAYTIFILRLQKGYIFKLITRKSKAVFEVLLNKPYHYHIHNNVADILQYTIQDIDKLFVTLASAMYLVENLMSMVLIIIVLLKTNVLLTVLAGTVIVVVMFGISKLISPTIKMLGEQNRIYIPQRLKWVYEARGSLKGVIVNKNQKFFVDGYEKATKEYATKQAKYEVMVAIPKCAIEAVVLGGIFFVCGFLLIALVDTSTLIPVFAMFAMAAYRLINIATNVNNSINSIRYNSNAIDALYTFFEDVNCENENNDNEFSGSMSIKNGISINNVSFKYEDMDNYLYENVSIKIPANKSVAFIGKTGSGKTTLADIIIGLHSPQQGEVLVDDKNIKNHPYAWSKSIGYIPQMIYLCEDTIRANVAFAVCEHEIDDDKVWKCLERAQLGEFVRGLPNGLDTDIGENGVRLSGGQRQRIGIARALYNDPPFIVMDEATSALDKDTEQSIIQAIDELAGEKTMLIIAHRLTTIKNCDYIYKIENGKIELIQKVD